MATATQIKERPILFSGQMVRAILDGTKTQTRRVVKPQPKPEFPHVWQADEIEPSGLWWQWYDFDRAGVTDLAEAVRCPYGRCGDQLWIRETCRGEELQDGLDGVRYLADNAFISIEETRAAADAWIDLYNYRGQRGATVPPIHAPRWASRITLEITDVRVERLQDISIRDAVAEGWPKQNDAYGETIVGPITRGQYVCGMSESFNDSGYGDDVIDWYADLWDTINGPGSWDANPWVWAISFRRVDATLTKGTT